MLGGSNGWSFSCLSKNNILKRQTREAYVKKAGKGLPKLVQDRIRQHFTIFQHTSLQHWTEKKILGLFKITS